MLQLEPENLKLCLKAVKYEGSIIGGLGIFTIAQSYLNDNQQAVTVQYSFPALDDAIPISFHVKSGEKQITSTILDMDAALIFAEKASHEGLPCDILVLDNQGSLSIAIGRIESGNMLTITIKYMQKQKTSMGKTRIIIPAIIAPKAPASHDVDFQIKYVPFGKIESIHSPSHKIKTELFQDAALITLDETVIPSSDYVLEIYESTPKNPIVYYNNTYCSWQFTPQFEANQKQAGAEYIFLVDCSSAMAGEKFVQVTDALSVCLRGLQEHDKFNIIAFENRCHYFSLKSLPFNQSSLDSATRWLAQLKPMGEASLMEALRHAYDDNHKNRVICLLTDGHAKDQAEMIDFVKEQQYGELYALGIDRASNAAFINDIAKAGGGCALLVQMGQRLDHAFLSLFYMASTIGLSDVKITPQGAVTDLSPRGMAQLYGNERICVVAKIIDQVPTKITFYGILNGKEYAEDVLFEKRHTLHDLRPLYSQTRLQALLCQLSTEENTSDKLIKREITNLSLNEEILTPYTTLAMLLQIKDQQGNPIEITVPALSTNNCKATPSIQNKEDCNPLSLMNGQKADGSFGNGSMLDTAKVLLTLFEHVKDATPYCWQIKKSIVFLFDFIQKGDYDVLPKEVILVFHVWCNSFAEQDLFAKKIQAIVLMNRDLL